MYRFFTNFLLVAYILQISQLDRLKDSHVLSALEQTAVTHIS